MNNTKSSPEDERTFDTLGLILQEPISRYQLSCERNSADANFALGDINVLARISCPTQQLPSFLEGTLTIRAVLRQVVWKRIYLNSLGTPAHLVNKITPRGNRIILAQAKEMNPMINHEESINGERLVTLLERYREGDANAFTQLVDVCQSWLVRTIRATLSKPDFALSHEDVIQEAFSKLADKKPRFHKDGQVFAWLRKTARRLALNTNRRRRPVANSALLECL